MVQHIEKLRKRLIFGLLVVGFDGNKLWVLSWCSANLLCLGVLVHLEWVHAPAWNSSETFWNSI